MPSHRTGYYQGKVHETEDLASLALGSGPVPTRCGHMIEDHGRVTDDLNSVDRSRQCGRCRRARDDSPRTQIRRIKALAEADPKGLVEASKILAILEVAS